MKKTFIALLALAGVGYAAPLNENDWAWVDDNAPGGIFGFNEIDKTLTITGNSNGKKLWYFIDGKDPNPMVNGSGLSITFQFDTDLFLNDDETELAIYLYGKDKDSEVHRFSVRTSKPEANIYDTYEGSFHDEYYQVDRSIAITRITVNYTVRDNKLCYNYSINGTNKVKEDVVANLTLDTTLNWRPGFGCSHTDTSAYTVTDVTFKSVPEPTTTALSLLALAGLAARRRR